MSKKHVSLNLPGKMLFAVMTVSLFAAVNAYPAAKDSKKDISDPVLQEIISKFSIRMPRFISKHGADIFVADAPITRGSLMLALNEYDTTLKFNKKDFVSRQEFDEFRTRLSIAEKPGGPVKGDKDITQLINELQPNMPVMLDNSLNNSKVFNALRDEIRSGEPSGPGKAQVTKKDFEELSLKVNNLALKPGPNAVIADSAKMMHEIDLLKSKMTAIESGSGSRPSAAPSPKEISDLKNRLELLEASKASVPSQMPANQNEQLSKTLSRIQQDIFSLKTRIDGAERKIQEDSKNGVLKSEFDSVKDKLDALQKSVVETKPGGSASYTTADVARKVSYLNSSFTQLQKQNEQAFKLSQSASYDVNKVNGDVSDLNAAVSRLRSQMARLESKIDNIDLSSASSDVPGQKSTLAKIGIGLGIVAAFLVAR